MSKRADHRPDFNATRKQLLVPELTRSGNIKLNGRVSLRSGMAAVSFAHEASSPLGCCIYGRVGSRGGLMTSNQHDRLASLRGVHAGLGCDLTAVIIADTPSIASAVIDSLPIECPFFLVGPKEIAFLGREKRCRQHFRNELSIDASSKADFVRTIERLDSNYSNVFLIPADESANHFLYSTGDRLAVLSYPMPDRVSFEILKDKWRFQQLCCELGVRVPNAVLINSKAEIDFDHLSTKLGLPFVLKPTNKCNGVGVRVIVSKDHFEKEVRANRNYNFAPLIAQAFVRDVDIDISLFADAGRIKNFAVQIRKQKTIHFVKSEELVEFAEVLVRHLHYTGLIHIDARLNSASGQISLVEANPRFWGSLDAATCCGLNFVQVGIFASMGHDSPEPSTISDVTMPSIRQMLAELATGRRRYLHMSSQLRLRLKHGMRDWMRARLHI